MKKILFLIFGILLNILYGQAQTTNPVEINVTINSTEVEGHIYLEKVNDRGFGETVDSVLIKKEPFMFKTVIPEPGIYQLNIANEQLIGLLLDGGEHFSVTADGMTTDEAPAGATIAGLPNMVVYNNLQLQQFEFNKKVKDIDDKFKASSNDDVREKLREDYLSLLKNHNESILEDVRSLGSSAAGILAANNFLSKEVSFDYFEELAAKIVEENKKFLLAQIFIQTVNQERIGKPGVTAPDFELKHLDGSTLRLSDLKGKRVILDFWATWCGPCLRAFPGMKMAMDNYKDRDDVAFVYINTFERMREDEINEHVKRFIETRGLEFLNTVMDQGNSVAALYGVGSIPTRFFIDEEGKFLHMSRGYAGSDEAVVEEIAEWFN